jgi:AcrR family transcriptional regulator
MSTPEATSRPLRADARRNREKIVAAARTTFAAKGLEAQMDDVARAAGVGVGTLYRHFPTKDDLVAAMVIEKMALMAGLAPSYLEAPDRDPWEAFTAFVGVCAEQHVVDRALTQVISTQPASTFLDAARDTGLLDSIGRLLRRAQESGIARPDLEATDVGMMMCGLGAVLEAFGEEGGRRHLALMLAGMRNREAPPLGGAAPRGGGPGG